MKLIAVGTFFLPLALASKGVFDGVDPLCRPCLNEAIAGGPGNTQSKKFANYLCMGQGASAVSLCITDCGTSTSGDINDIPAAGARVDLIMGIVFGYCVQYYPEETCAVFEGTEFAQLPPCPEIRNGEKNGGNDSNRSSSEISTTEAPASETTEDQAPDATETTGSGYSHVTYSASGSDSTGVSPQPTSSPGSDSSDSGSSHTSAGGVPAAMGAFASWEMLIGLVMLAVNI
ncbi:hypothetical protein BFJ70_g13030 [Fusarium oxysporum]|nr:hypothetical protein BFJ70_g13030 [Fusarium oxysporum]